MKCPIIHRLDEANPRVVVARKRTRVSTENLDLWRAAGLPLDEEGRLAGNVLTPDVHENQHQMEEVVVYGLLRLLCKIVNLCADDGADDSDTMVSSRNQTEQQGDAWSAVSSELDTWYHALPTSFQSELTLPYSKDDGGSRPPDSRKCFSIEKWFPNPICAVGMAYYRMAHMLLVIQRPALSMPAHRHFDLLRAYRELQHELQGSATKIFAIALGHTEESVRLRLLQPLYVSGRCLIDPQERKMLVKMLRAIEAELGVATAYRVRDLMDEWGTSEEELDLPL